MKIIKILVHLHLYYHDQTDYFLEKLKNLDGYDWHLVVTYSEPHQPSFEKIRNFKTDTTFVDIENIGYDIWPFIKVIKDTSLEEYDYVVKLHTKRSVRRCAANVISMSGYEWRNALVDGILYSPQYFAELLKVFEKYPKIGMISNLKTYSKRNWETYLPKVKKELEKLGLNCHGDHFCMGTMFIARAKILPPLQNSNLIPDFFADTLEDKKRDFTSAHYYERLLGVLPESQGFIHLPKIPKIKEFLRIKTTRALEKPVRWIFGIEKKGPDKRKFIRIFGFEFYIQGSKKQRN